MNSIVSFLSWLVNEETILFFFSIIILIFIFSAWVRDIIRERTIQGFHSIRVVRALKFGIILFIISEVIFFFSFFWTFFHRALNPRIELGGSWPPLGVEPINPLHVPLLNSLILISSGVRITFCHHKVLNSSYYESVVWGLITFLLGLYFTFLQYIEYKYARFSFRDSVYGGIFFLATGFHGFHVIIGSIFIAVNIFRLFRFHFSMNHHLGLELAAWYWHFVDLIWLFLFVIIYCWGW